jgi:hypothetical protein
MAFMVCSCDTTKAKKEKAVTDYVSSFMKGEDYQVIEITEYKPITTYEEYINEINDKLKECNERLERYSSWDILNGNLYILEELEGVPHIESATYSTKRIATLLHIRSDIEMAISLSTNKEYFTPKYVVNCEYKYKGMENSIWLLLEYVEYEDKYKVHLMTNGWFNMEP